MIRINGPLPWLVLLLMAAADGGLAETVDPRTHPGGTGTVLLDTADAFSAPMATVSGTDHVRFHRGGAVFRRLWGMTAVLDKAAAGLGPLYNRDSCSGCHMRDGRGRPPSAHDRALRTAVLLLGLPDGRPDPVYGRQIQDKAVIGVAPEGRVAVTYEAVHLDLGAGRVATLRRPTPSLRDLGYGPLAENAAVSLRVAPALIGLGLLEAVPARDLARMADPDDADGDGISGRVNRLTDDTGQPQIGRFGWKASLPTLRGQIAQALRRDIGIRNPVHPVEPCPPSTDCHGRRGLEMDEAALADLVFYAGLLAVPARRALEDPAVARGDELFHAAGCAACHRPVLTTAAAAVHPALAGQTIAPYTDLLLHDMGPDLADGIVAGQASGREWRTAPLWGIGLIPLVNGHDRLLHDGRAAGVLEAIWWHGGEAAAARAAVAAMPPADQAAVAAFVNSL